jgi:hypothetical protein
MKTHKYNQSSKKALLFEDFSGEEGIFEVSVPFFSDSAAIATTKKNSVSTDTVSSITEPPIQPTSERPIMDTGKKITSTDNRSNKSSTHEDADIETSFDLELVSLHEQSPSVAASDGVVPKAIEENTDPDDPTIVTFEKKSIADGLPGEEVIEVGIATTQDTDASPDDEVFFDVAVGNSDQVDEVKSDTGIYKIPAETLATAVKTESPSNPLSTIPIDDSDEKISVVYEPIGIPDSDFDATLDTVADFELFIDTTGISSHHTIEIPSTTPVDSAKVLPNSVISGDALSEQTVSDFEKAFLVPVDTTADDEAVFEVALQDTGIVSATPGIPMDDLSTEAIFEVLIPEMPPVPDQPLPTHQELLPIAASIPVNDSSIVTELTADIKTFTPSFWQAPDDSPETPPVISDRENLQTYPTDTAAFFPVTLDKKEDTATIRNQPFPRETDIDAIIEKTAIETVIYNPETGYVSLSIDPAPSVNSSVNSSSPPGADNKKPAMEIQPARPTDAGQPVERFDDMTNEVIFEVSDTVLSAQSTVDVSSVKTVDETPLPDLQISPPFSDDSEIAVDFELIADTSNEYLLETSIILSPIVKPESPSAETGAAPDASVITTDKVVPASVEPPPSVIVPIDTIDDEEVNFEVASFNSDDAADIPVFEISNGPKNIVAH